jgi:hydrogenase nickel incorporation protein HypA/HybF
MHELSIAQNIIEILEDERRRQPFERVASIRLRIGVLSNIVPDTLRFCFEAIRDETLARGAELLIDTVPGRADCASCRAEVLIEEPVLLCPACGSGGLTLLSGEEMDIASVDVV